MIITETDKSYIFRNDFLYFEAGKNGAALSLKNALTDEELLADSTTPLFTMTQDRFFHNELKLIHPSREITLPCDKIRLAGSSLIASFSPLPYEAEIEITDKNSYLVFTLRDFILPENGYGGIAVALPPATKSRFLQLHLKKSDFFGEWLNAVHSDTDAAALVGTDTKTDIGSIKTPEGYILFADAIKGISFRKSTAALIVSNKNTFLDKLEALENDFSLPSGVASRRCNEINACVYWVHDASPDNIDTHIEYAKKGGFSMMLMYYTCFVKEYGGYLLCGNYDLKDEYKNGLSDIKAMVEKIKSQGITPGFHFLHSHIGLKSRYFTPEADHRVMLRQTLTLSEDASENDTELYVDNYPYEASLPECCRVLRFGTELIQFESCTEDYPYCYKGCVRGYNGTKAQRHKRGSGGGVVLISEFGATSGYCDQNSSLQEKIAEKIAAIYNQGFRFIYFDGSEGVNAPYNYQIPEAQYRIYKRLTPPPLFCEAAAKGHFSWHMLSGGNAFDIFPTDIFKAMIKKYPLSEAEVMQMDFTRINFGWWGYFRDSRPDVFEYGTSHAAAYDCPITIQSSIENSRLNILTDDNFEVLRRWEDVRKRKLLTPQQKEMLKDPDREFMLLENSDNSYELVEIFPEAAPTDGITACSFERNGRKHLLLCPEREEKRLCLPIKSCTVRRYRDNHIIPSESTPDGTAFTLSCRCIIEQCP